MPLGVSGGVASSRAGAAGRSSRRAIMMPIVSKESGRQAYAATLLRNVTPRTFRDPVFPAETTSQAGPLGSGTKNLQAAPWHSGGCAGRPACLTGRCRIGRVEVLPIKEGNLDNGHLTTPNNACDNHRTRRRQDALDFAGRSTFSGLEIAGVLDDADVVFNPQGSPPLPPAVFDLHVRERDPDGVFANQGDGGYWIGAAYVLEKARLRGVAGLGDKDADGGIVPAVRFSDLKIEPRKIVDFAKYLGETRTVGAKRHQPIEADNSRRDSDEPTESAYVEEREVRQPQPQRPARACRRNLPTEQRVAQPAGNRNNHKDNIFGNTTSTCILRSAECTAFPAFVASRDVATLVLRIEAVRLFFFRVA
jgi:hypothetical protein